MVLHEEPREKSTQIWSTDFLQRCRGNLSEKGESFQQMVLLQVDIYMQKNEPQPLLHAIHKY